MIDQLRDSRIKLKRMFIESRLPEELAPLTDLANNIWWSWNPDAAELFRSIDEKRWIASEYNPVSFLEELTVDDWRRLTADKDFMNRLKRVKKQFDAYLKEKPDPKLPLIAYFSMEYGLHVSLHLYSGGLGVLAGDFLKEASDSNVRMAGIGLLYRFGYFQQAVSMRGDQISQYPHQQFTKLPVQPVRDEAGNWVKISVGMQGRMVFAKIWELRIGRISLYLLDADIDENSVEDRGLTAQLYGGDNEHRLRQEILLGIGGVRALKALGIDADIYHCNEGHAAFLGLERLKNLVEEAGLNFDEALEAVRASSLFTTHTPVPAGHDYFPESLLKSYLYNYAFDLGISWERFVSLGKIDPQNSSELFSMSHLAIRLSQEVNGVSKLHGDVSKKMFNALYPGYIPEELHIGYVTNSVHYPTWIAREWHDLYVETFGPEFLEDQSNKKYWRNIHQVSAERIMHIRETLKRKLFTYVKARLQTDLMRRGENPRGIFETLQKMEEKALVVGFARRFATYKRANLLFSNLKKLEKIVNDPERPVMFIFSGKAHPADGGGQELIRHIINVSQMPEFVGKIIFLENYSMEVAKILVQGVDIWLNTPVRPKEASGTSGMKAVMNGVMNFSVLDGWWAEGYRPEAGWALPLERTYEDQPLQNELDAETVYNILEDEIIPAFFSRNEQGISEKWVSYIKNTIAEVAPEFTMKRMLDDYFARFYNKLHERSRQLKAGNYRKARELARWKAKVDRNWFDMTIAEADFFDADNYPLPMGKPFEGTLRLDIGDLPAEQVGVEIVFFRRTGEDNLQIQLVQELELKGHKGSIATYSCAADPKTAGVLEYGFRIFPKHELLPHRQDFPVVRWG
jgi:glycogen phosphorylase